MRIRDGWIRTQAAGGKAETKRDVEIKVMVESTKKTHRGEKMCLSVSMTLYMNYMYDLDKSFHWACVLSGWEDNSMSKYVH